LRFGRRQGIVSLAGAAKLNLAALTTTNIAFGLAPRLNAAGRLESAHDAYHLLVTRDLSEAGFLAQKLDDQNTKRQTQTREMQQIAERQLVEADEEFILFAIDPEFKAGLVGLVAARLTDVFYRPAVVCSWVDGAIRASCRSIPGFHITQALDQCADILVRHGGHEAAAGFTVSEEYYGQLKERLSKIAWEELAGLDLRPVIRIDREMHLQELKADLLDWMEMFQPTGQNNPEVVFCSRNLKVVTAKTVGNDKTHLKFSVSEDGLVFDAIAFRFGHMAANMPKKVDLAYQFEKNYYLGRESLQLKVVDIKPGGTPD